MLVVFGGGRIGEIGGALGKGIREFKGSIKDEDAEPAPPPAPAASTAPPPPEPAPERAPVAPEAAPAPASPAAPMAGPAAPSPASAARRQRRLRPRHAASGGAPRCLRRPTGAHAASDRAQLLRLCPPASSPPPPDAASARADAQTAASAAVAAGSVATEPLRPGAADPARRAAGSLDNRRAGGSGGRPSPTGAPSPCTFLPRRRGAQVELLRRRGRAGRAGASDDGADAPALASPLPMERARARAPRWAGWGRAGVVIGVDDALATILARFAPLEPEERPILDALGQVLAAGRPGRRFDVPPLTNAAMDGYAVRAADTAGAGDADRSACRSSRTCRPAAAPSASVEPGRRSGS